MSSEAAVYAIGVCVSIVISTINSTGMGLQKKVHREIAAEPGTKRMYYKERRWQLGLVCMAAASLLVLVNYWILGQSKASAMASLTIISNAVMSRYYLKEELTRVDVASGAVIMTGIVVAVAWGAASGGGSGGSLDELVGILSRNTVYVCSAAAAAGVLACEAFIYYCEKLGERRSAWHSLADCCTRALLAGLFSGSTGFFAKAVVVSFSEMFRVHSASNFGSGYFWLFLLGLPSSIFLQLRSLNSALARYEALLVVPIYQSCIVVIGVLWGWAFYAENEALPATNQAMFLAGCLISVFGIGLLGCKPRKSGAAAAAEQTGKGGGLASAMDTGGDTPAPGSEPRPADAAAPVPISTRASFRGASMRLSRATSLAGVDMWPDDWPMDVIPHSMAALTGAGAAGAAAGDSGAPGSGPVPAGVVSVLRAAPSDGSGAEPDGGASSTLLGGGLRGLLGKGYSLMGDGAERAGGSSSGAGASGGSGAGSSVGAALTASSPLGSYGGGYGTGGAGSPVLGAVTVEMRAHR